MEYETEKLRAVDDKGNVHQILKITPIHTIRDVDGSAKRRGLPEYRLDDGSNVNKLSDSEFQVVQSGIKLRLIS